MKPKTHFSGKEVRAWGNQHGKGKTKKKPKRNFNNLYGLIIAFAILYAGGSILIRFAPKGEIQYTAHAEAETIESPKTIAEKIAELKTSIRNNIRSCESAGKSEDDGIIEFDPSLTNKKVAPASLGTFQFKQSTVIYYYKKLYNRTISGKDAVLIALDDSKASELFDDIMFGTDNGTREWMNCSAKYHVADTLKIIKMLEK